VATADLEEWRAFRRIRDAREAKERQRDELGRTDVPVGHPHHIDNLPESLRYAWDRLNREAADLLEAEVSAHKRLTTDGS
jgi:hypothetical protein